MARPETQTLNGIEELAALCARGRVAVLTGAGCSTESGIPDYRGPETRRRARNPVQYRAFVDDAEARARYWARSMVGWPRFRQARPNAAHQALARLERAGVVSGIVTQNVDGLHQAAGSRRVVELHGTLAEVVCLWCGEVEPRDGFQVRLAEANPAWVPRTAVELAPDGDAELEPECRLAVPGCQVCGGVLKPRVVFFGENCDRETVASSFDLVRGADVLLVVGSSLAVFSGYRFVLDAAKRGQPRALVNLGPPHRGLDHLPTWLDASAGLTLSALAERMNA